MQKRRALLFPVRPPGWTRERGCAGRRGRAGTGGWSCPRTGERGVTRRCPESWPESQPHASVLFSAALGLSVLRVSVLLDETLLLGTPRSLRAASSDGHQPLGSSGRRRDGTGGVTGANGSRGRGPGAPLGASSHFQDKSCDQQRQDHRLRILWSENVSRPTGQRPNRPRCGGGHRTGDGGRGREDGRTGEGGRGRG